LALSVEKTFDGADVGAGEADLVVADGTAGAGFGEPCEGAVGGDTIGLEAPILSLIVGGGGGASVWWGRSNGGGGGWAGGWEGGTAKPFPGTNSKALALSLLIIYATASGSVGGRGQVADLVVADFAK
jgi:hypothetical protein